jgi:uridylate kinase
VLIKATKVDAIYDDDPLSNPDAQRFSEISYIEALNMRVRVMDSTAISLCMDNNLPIIVLNLWDKGSVRRLVMGESVGTVIRDFDGVKTA